MTSLPGGTVTFAFTDIEGSTRLLQKLGDDDASVSRDHRLILREAFGARGGTEIDIIPACARCCVGGGARANGAPHRRAAAEGHPARAHLRGVRRRCTARQQAAETVLMKLAPGSLGILIGLVVLAIVVVVAIWLLVRLVF
jgi:class 3 adenylate cyclase